MSAIPTPHRFRTDYEEVMSKRLFTVPLWLYAIVEFTRGAKKHLLTATLTVVVLGLILAVLVYPFTKSKAWHRPSTDENGVGEIVWVEIGGEYKLFKDLTIKEQKAARSFEFGGFVGPNPEEEFRKKTRGKKKPQ